MPKWLSELEAANKAATHERETSSMRVKHLDYVQLLIGFGPAIIRALRAAKAAEEYVPCTCEPDLPNERCPGCALRTALEGTDDGE